MDCDTDRLTGWWLRCRNQYGLYTMGDSRGTSSPQQCLSAIDVKLGPGTTWKPNIMRLEGETGTEGFAKRDASSVLGKPGRLCCIARSDMRFVERLS